MYFLDGDDDDDKDTPMTTHGDTSPDPGEEKYTDPRVGEGDDLKDEPV